MEEEKSQIEIVEEKPTEKIGFDHPPMENVDGTSPAKKKIKFSNQRKTGLQKATFGFFIPAMIFSVGSLAFFFMPILSAIAGVFAFLIIGTVIIVPIMATMFLILLVEEYRQFVGAAWQKVEWFFDAPNHLNELSPFYPYVAFPALILDLVVIILAIITLTKGQKGVVTYLIVTSIIFIFLSIVTIIYFASGLQIPRLN